VTAYQEVETDTHGGLPASQTLGQVLAKFKDRVHHLALSREPAVRHGLRCTGTWSQSRPSPPYGQIDDSV